MDAVSASVQGGTSSTMAGNTNSAAAATNNDLSQYAQVIQHYIHIIMFYYNHRRIMLRHLDYKVLINKLVPHQQINLKML